MGASDIRGPHPKRGTLVPERSLQAYYPELARIGVETRIDGGGILWHEGDRGDTVALLLEGTLEVVHEPPDGEEVVLRSLEHGAVVGELAGTEGPAPPAPPAPRAPLPPPAPPRPHVHSLL